MAIVLFAVAFLLAAGCSDRSESAAASAAPIVIEPHIAVGKIHAGMAMKQIVATLGEPPRQTGKALEYPRLGLAVLPGPDGLVEFVMCGDVTGISGPFVKAFTGRTKEGIGMLSTRDEVLKVYGPPTADEKMRLGFESLRYDPLGITFTLDGGKVHHMVVRLDTGETNQSMKIELAPQPK